MCQQIFWSICSFCVSLYVFALSADLYAAFLTIVDMYGSIQYSYKCIRSLICYSQHVVKKTQCHFCITYCLLRALDCHPPHLPCIYSWESTSPAENLLLSCACVSSKCEKRLKLFAYSSEHLKCSCVKMAFDCIHIWKKRISFMAVTRGLNSFPAQQQLHQIKTENQPLILKGSQYVYMNTSHTIHTYSDLYCLHSIQNVNQHVSSCCPTLHACQSSAKQVVFCTHASHTMHEQTQ